MVGNAKGTSNKARSLAFRNDVLLYLRDQGLSSANRRPETRGLTYAQREARDVGDIVGLPWVLGVRCQQSINLSGALDEVAAEAEHAGVRDYASVQHRKGRPTSAAYVTMPLHVFVRVLEGAVRQVT